MIQNKEKIQENKSILQPKNDVVFHALFTRGKESITKALLEDILKIKIDKLELDKNTELTNDNIRNKNGRLDLRAIINGNIECDIEMQLITHNNMLERFVYYWSKIYASNLDIGENYSKLRKTISIIIVDDEIKQLKDIKKSHTRWHIREEEYKEKVLTPYFQVDIIEMKKAIQEYETNSSDEVLQWMKFLDNPEDEEVVKIMEENNNIKEAKEELNTISQDETIRRIALREKLARMDYEQCMYEARMEGLKEGREKGLKKGKKEGIEQGYKKKNLEIAQKMLEENMEIELIEKITGLTKEEINSIDKN